MVTATALDSPAAVSNGAAFVALLAAKAVSRMCYSSSLFLVDRRLGVDGDSKMMGDGEVASRNAGSSTYSSPSGRAVANARVAMLVWNGFVSDARVLREAESLARNGMELSIVAIRTAARDVADERVAAGIRVCRVSRRAGWLGRLIMLPRNGFRLARMQFAAKRTSRLDPPRWWELDRRLVLLVSELAVNFRMVRQATSFRPDVVHAHDVNTLFPAWLVARRCGAKLVYDAHEISADREGYHGRIWLVKLVERLLGRAADGRVTTTQARADWFRKEYGYPDMVVLQNRPVKRIVERTDRIRRTFGIPADRPVVLYQGGLQWGRGLRNLLEAVRELPEVHLAFVGDGVQRMSLEAQAADISDRVHFTGLVPLDELPEWTASADVGVQCLRNTCLNHYTTDSNKLFEYVMAGLPVVASDFPEIRQIVDKYQLGILVDPHSVQAIKDALRRILDNATLRNLFAVNARRARDELDWASQETNLLTLYQHILDS